MSASGYRTWQSRTRDSPMPADVRSGLLVADDDVIEDGAVDRELETWTDGSSADWKRGSYSERGWIKNGPEICSIWLMDVLTT
jgi:hypothetical protein